jgi:hypothetical protein
MSYIVILSLILTYINSADADRLNIPWNHLSLESKANILIADISMFYIKDQLKKCYEVQNPKNYSDCQPAITDPSASCCFISSFQEFTGLNKTTCIPIPTKYPELYQHYLNGIKEIRFECPFLSNNKNLYVDKLIYNIDESDLHKLISTAESMENVNSSKICPISEFDHPTSPQQCFSSVNSTFQKCCFLSGNNGTVSVNSCVPIAIEASSVYDYLLSKIGVKLNCNVPRG